jgi:hypothetical protein
LMMDMDIAKTPGAEVRWVRPGDAGRPFAYRRAAGRFARRKRFPPLAFWGG